MGFTYLSRMKKSFKGWTSPKKRVMVLPPLPLWLSLRFQTLLTSLRHLQHQKQFLSILAGRQSCIPPDQCVLQGKHPHQPLSLDQEEDLKYFPIPPQLPVHPVCLKLCHCQPTSSPPPRALALTKPSTPPRGFTGVTSCLRVPEFEETGQEAFENTTSIGLVATPAIFSVFVT